MNDWDMGTPDANLLAQASGIETPTDLIAAGGTLQKAGGTYATAVKVQHPRNLNDKTKQLCAEARIAGEAFYYGWGSGKDRVLGPSIGLAMAAARVWGNCVVEPAPLQDTKDAWIITMTFVDLETGFTVGRQFRQDKQWTVHGKFDAARKDDIRFQIGQSKAARNVILQAVPKWLIDLAMKEAMAGVRERVEKFIATKGLAAAQDLVIDGLAKHGVSEEAVLDKMKVSERKALSVDHIVALRGDLYCLDEGQDRAPELFPSMKTAAAGGEQQTSDLDARLDGDAPNEPPTAPKPPTPPRPAASQPEPQGPTVDELQQGPSVDSAVVDNSGAPTVAQEPTVQDIDPETGEVIPADLPTQEERDAQDLGASVDATGKGIATEEPEDEGEATYPSGFMARVAGCKAVGQLEILKAELEEQGVRREVLELCNAKCDERIAEIRRAYRGI